MGIVGDLRVKASQIEAIKDVLFLDLAEVLISLRRQEPRDPLETFLRILTRFSDKFRIIPS